MVGRPLAADAAASSGAHNAAAARSLAALAAAPRPLQRDLAERPRPQRTAECWRSAAAASALPPSAIQDFLRDGFVSNVPLLTEEETARVAAAINRVKALGEGHPGFAFLHEFHRSQRGNEAEDVVSHALGHWRLEEALWELVYNQKMTLVAGELLAAMKADSGQGGEQGPERARRVPVRLWHDQFFSKPAGVGGGVSWHQDMSYWTRTAPVAHLTCHVALDAQTEQNGGLQFVPGSHRWTRDGGAPMPMLDADFASDEASFLASLRPEEREAFRPVPSRLKRGEASFHHALTVHGSGANKSAGPRRAVVVNICADGTAATVAGCLLPGTPPLKAGDALGAGETARFFPLLFDDAWLH